MRTPGGWVVDILVGWIAGSIALGLPLDILGAFIGGEGPLRATGVVVGTGLGIGYMRYSRWRRNARTTPVGHLSFGRNLGDRALTFAYVPETQDPKAINTMLQSAPTTFVIGMRHHLTDARAQALVQYGADMSDPGFSPRGVIVHQNYNWPYPKGAVGVYRENRKTMQFAWAMEKWELDDSFDVLGVLVGLADTNGLAHECRGLLAGLHYSWNAGSDMPNDMLYALSLNTYNWQRKPHN
jgi:hypothetical protein